MVKKDLGEVTVSVNGGPAVTAAVFDAAVEAITKEVPANKLQVAGLVDSKAYKAVVKHFGDDVASAIANVETEIQLKNGIGNCQSKVFRATDEMEANNAYQAAAEIVADFKGALREATAGDNAAIKLRRLKLSFLRK